MPKNDFKKKRQAFNKKIDSIGMSLREIEDSISPKSKRNKKLEDDRIRENEELLASINEMSDKLNDNLDRINSTMEKNTSVMKETIESSLNLVNDTVRESGKTFGSLLTKAAPFLAVGAAAGTAGYIGAKKLGKAASAPLVYPTKYGYRAAKSTAGFIAQPGEEIMSGEAQATAKDAKRLGAMSVLGGPVASAGVGALTDALKTLRGEKGYSEKDHRDGATVFGTKRATEGFFSRIGETIGHFFDDKFASRRGDSLRIDAGDEFGDDLDDIKESLHESVKYRKADEDSREKLVEVLDEQLELTDLQMTGGTPGFLPRSRRGKKIRTMMMRKNTKGETSALKEAISESIEKTQRGFGGNFEKSFGLGSTVAYSFPVFGSGYKSELPSPKEGLFPSILKVLGMIYVSTRFAADENNSLLLQIAEISRIGFGLEGKVKPPAGRSLSAVLGGLIRGYSKKYIMEKAKAGYFGEYAKQNIHESEYAFAIEDTNIPRFAKAEKMGPQHVTKSGLAYLDEDDIVVHKSHVGESEKYQEGKGSKGDNVNPQEDEPQSKLGMIGSFLSGLPIIGGLFSGLFKLPVYLKSIYEYVKTLYSKLVGDEGILNKTLKSLVLIKDFVMGKGKYEKNVFSRIYNLLKEQFKNNSFDSLMEKIGVTVQGISKSYAEFLTKEFEDDGLFKKLIHTLIPLFVREFFKEVGVSVLKIGVEPTLKLLVSIVDTIKNVANEVKTYAKSVTEPISKAIKDSEGFFDTTKNILKAVPETIGKVFTEAGTMFKNIGLDVWNLIKQGYDYYVNEGIRQFQLYKTIAGEKATLFGSAADQFLPTRWSKIIHEYFDIMVKVNSAQMDMILKLFQTQEAMLDEFGNVVGTKKLGFGAGKEDYLKKHGLEDTELSAGQKIKSNLAGIKEQAAHTVSPITDILKQGKDDVSMIKDEFINKGFGEFKTDASVIKEKGSKAVSGAKTALLDAKSLIDEAVGLTPKVSPAEEKARSGAFVKSEGSVFVHPGEIIASPEKISQYFRLAFTKDHPLPVQLVGGFGFRTSAKKDKSEEKSGMIAKFVESIKDKLNDLFGSRVFIKTIRKEFIDPIVSSMVPKKIMINKLENIIAILKSIADDKKVSLKNLKYEEDKPGFFMSLFKRLLSWRKKDHAEVAETQTEKLKKHQEGFFSKIISGIGSAIQGVGGNIGNVLEFGFNALQKSINGLSEVVSTGWKGVKFGISKLTDIITAPFQILKNIIMKPIKWFGSIFSSIKEAITSKFKSTVRGELIGIGPKGQEIRVKHGFEAIYQAITQFMDEQYEIGTKSFNMLKMFVMSHIPEADRIKLRLKKRGYAEKKSSMSEFFNKMFDALGSVKTEIATALGITGGAAGIGAGIKSLFRGGASAKSATATKGAKAASKSGGIVNFFKNLGKGGKGVKAADNVSDISKAAKLLDTSTDVANVTKGASKLAKITEFTSKVSKAVPDEAVSTLKFLGRGGKVLGKGLAFVSAIFALFDFLSGFSKAGSILDVENPGILSRSVAGVSNMFAGGSKKGGIGGMMMGGLAGLGIGSTLAIVSGGTGSVLIPATVILGMIAGGFGAEKFAKGTMTGLKATGGFLGGILKAPFEGGLLGGLMGGIAGMAFGPIGLFLGAAIGYAGIRGTGASIWNKTKAFFGEIINFIMHPIQTWEQWGGFIGLLEKTVGGLIQLVLWPFDKVSSIMAEIGVKIYDYFKDGKLIENIKNVFFGVTRAIGEFIKNPASTKDLVSSVGDMIVEAFVAAKNAMGNLGGRIWDAIMFVLTGKKSGGYSGWSFGAAVDWGIDKFMSGVGLSEPAEKTSTNVSAHDVSTELNTTNSSDIASMQVDRDISVQKAAMTGTEAGLGALTDEYRTGTATTTAAMSNVVSSSMTSINNVISNYGQSSKQSAPDLIADAIFWANFGNV